MTITYNVSVKYTGENNMDKRMIEVNTKLAKVINHYLSCGLRKEDKAL